MSANWTVLRWPWHTHPAQNPWASLKPQALPQLLGLAAAPETASSFTLWGQLSILSSLSAWDTTGWEVGVSSMSLGQPCMPGSPSLSLVSSNILSLQAKLSCLPHQPQSRTLGAGPLQAVGDSFLLRGLGPFSLLLGA